MNEDTNAAMNQDLTVAMELDNGADGIENAYDYQAEMGRLQDLLGEDAKILWEQVHSVINEFDYEGSPIYGELKKETLDDIVDTVVARIMNTENGFDTAAAEQLQTAQYNGYHHGHHNHHHMRNHAESLVLWDIYGRRRPWRWFWGTPYWHKHHHQPHHQPHPQPYPRPKPFPYIY